MLLTVRNAEEQDTILKGTVYVQTKSLLLILSLAATLNVVSPHCAIIFVVSSNNQEKEGELWED